MSFSSMEMEEKLRSFPARDAASAGGSAHLQEPRLLEEWPRDAEALAAFAGEASHPSVSMAEIHRLADLVATGTIAIVVSGETGVGKEVLAQRIHERSPRAGKPFVRINCAAFSDKTIEGELFGYERGAFGALTLKPGLLESAAGGTLLLDEVGELPLSIQAKLLRAIGSREVLRVGATRPLPLDVRFIASTNRSLEELVAAGKFREDLFFRLNGVTFEVPPLRQRRDELEGFIDAFLLGAARAIGRPCPRLSEPARSALLEHDYPGNVRELKNVLERATLLAVDGVVRLEHLALHRRAPRVTASDSAPPVSGERSRPSRFPLAGSSERLKDQIRELERERIVEALARSGGSQTKAAVLLGISRRALLHRLDAYDLPRPRKGKSQTV